MALIELWVWERALRLNSQAVKNLPLMKNFFKFVFASCLGMFLFIIAFGLIGSVWLGRLASAESKPKPVKPNSVLKITLDKPIPERTDNVPIDFSNLKEEKTLGLSDILRTIEAAKNDDRIEGIYLEIDISPIGLSTATELRRALEDFADSGKFVYAWSRYYDQRAYYLASVADGVLLHPLGLIDLRGFGAVVPYFKNMLDKVGIEMEVFYAGNYKSATEPFRLTEMSEYNRRQLHEYLDPLAEEFLGKIAEARDLPFDSLEAIVNRFDSRSALLCLEKGLVDALTWKDSVRTLIREELGLDEDDDVPVVTLARYFEHARPEVDYSIKDRIAVVYAEGPIVDGKGEQGQIGDEKYTKILRKIRESDRIKAVVLRVNSPGGSAVASDNIWREIELLKEAGKPVVVSMGDYAASGGYYISCNADSIFAEPNTLTGSIGVFWMFPNMSELFNEKLGITWDTVHTHPWATRLNPYFPLSDEEKAVMQQQTERIYDVFLSRVSAGRGLPIDSVQAIAQGRIWSGRKALEIGLVDALGDLDRAIASAAAMAGLEHYRIKEYPQIKEPLQQLLDDLMGTDESDLAVKAMQTELGPYYPMYEQLRTMLQSAGPQARLPFLLDY